jgi:O-antigen/teichoic acid export membrane protein
MAVRILVFIFGLIFFYSAFYAQEPLYEAVGQPLHLKRLTLVVTGVNLVLTFYLVPAAGLWGAACATMLTMLVDLILFGRELPRICRVDKAVLVVSALSLYLFYMLFKGRLWGGLLSPVALFALFYLTGLYGVRHSYHPNQERVKT